MNLDPFEEQLRRQPLRAIPPGWKDEILGSVPDTARPSAVHPARLQEAPYWRASLDRLWPHPVAWGALAAVWAVILALNLATPGRPADLAQDRTPARRQAPTLKQTLQLMAEQRRELTELLGSEPTPTPARPAPTPRPRSERRLPVALT